MKTNRDGKHRLYCVVKRAAVRELPDNESRIIRYITFGENVLTNCLTPVNGKIEVEFHIRDKNGENITGWVPLKAFTKYQVMDYGKLSFTNLTGKRLPVSNKYHGEKIGVIYPNEIVSVIARVHDWCLTNRGWTMFGWLTKDRDIFEQAEIDTLLYGVMEWAVKDYRKIVKKIRTVKYKNKTEFCEMMQELENIILWFISDEYSMMFNSVPGSERLDGLNEELGIDKKWLKEKFCIRDAIVERKNRKKRR